MAIRLRPAWALLLSAAAHLGLFLALDGAAVTVAVPPGQKPAATMTVELKPADSAPEQTVLAPSPARNGSRGASAAQAPADHARTGDSPRPHYLEAGEWTDAPALMQDIAADQMLVSPRLTAAALRITLFINEEGGIDKVAIDAPSLPAFEQQLVNAAFAELRFEPARLRGLAVKSSLKIELKLENSRSEPAPG
jgi:hypothetical protein